MTKRLKLYHGRICPTCERVKSALDEAGIPYESKPLEDGANFNVVQSKCNLNDWNMDDLSMPIAITTNCFATGDDVLIDLEEILADLAMAYTPEIQAVVAAY